jgi:hypothetical protein
VDGWGVWCVFVCSRFWAFDIRCCIVYYILYLILLYYTYTYTIIIYYYILLYLIHILYYTLHLPLIYSFPIYSLTIQSSSSSLSNPSNIHSILVGTYIYLFIFNPPHSFSNKISFNIKGNTHLSLSQRNTHLSINSS